MKHINLYPNQTKALTQIAETLGMTFSEFVNQLFSDNSFYYIEEVKESSIDGSLTVLNNINSNLSQIKQLCNDYIIKNQLRTYRSEVKYDDFTSLINELKKDPNLIKLNHNPKAFVIAEYLLLEALKRVEDILNAEFKTRQYDTVSETPQFFLKGIELFKMIPENTKRKPKDLTFRYGDKLNEMKENDFFYNKVSELNKVLKEFQLSSEYFIQNDYIKNNKNKKLASSLNTLIDLTKIDLSSNKNQFDVYEDYFISQLLNESKFKTKQVDYSQLAIEIHKKTLEQLKVLNDNVRQYHQADIELQSQSIKNSVDENDLEPMLLKKMYFIAKNIRGYADIYKRKQKENSL